MTYPLTTTLNRIWAANPCPKGRDRALAAAGKTAPDDEPITYVQIVEAVGIDDALWCCRAEPQYSRDWRLFAVWCARQVEHLVTDPRIIAALNVAERYANGEASGEERAAAWAAARDVAGAAAWAAARAAARAAAWAAARDVAGDAAWAAAWAAARDAAGDAAWDVAGDAAWAAAWAAQQQAFLQLVTTGTLPAGEVESTP